MQHVVLTARRYRATETVWAIEATIADSPLASLVPTGDAAYAVVALYLGLEMLSHLDGDRTHARALFDHASRFAMLSTGTPASNANPKET